MLPTKNYVLKLDLNFGMSQDWKNVLPSKKRFWNPRITNFDYYDYRYYHYEWNPRLIGWTVAIQYRSVYQHHFSHSKSLKVLQNWRINHLPGVSLCPWQGLYRYTKELRLLRHLLHCAPSTPSEVCRAIESWSAGTKRWLTVAGTQKAKAWGMTASVRWSYVDVNGCQRDKTGIAWYEENWILNITEYGCRIPGSPFRLLFGRGLLSHLAGVEACLEIVDCNSLATAS
jgi:hypothetical protein